MVHLQPYTDPEARRIMDEFDRAGAEFLFYTYRISGNDEYARHCSAAKDALKNACDFQEERWLSAHVRRRWTTDFDLLEGSGERISLRRFLGQRYAILQKGAIIIDGKEYQPQIDPHPDYAHNDHDVSGFCEALLHPPYGMRREDGSLPAERKMFDRFAAAVFSDPDRLVVYRWSTDCSDFFDAGKEWWGAYFWTIYNPVKEMYIAALASSTD